jgi:hypothetical protein
MDRRRKIWALFGLSVMAKGRRLGRSWRDTEHKFDPAEERNIVTLRDAPLQRDGKSLALMEVLANPSLWSRQKKRYLPAVRVIRRT